MTDSIRRIGLQTPIAVYDCEDGRFLVAGRHRVEAYKALGRTEIDAHVFTDKREAELWSVAENLHRAELTSLARAEAEERWHLMTTGRILRKPSAKRRGRPPAGIRQTARELGISEKEVRNAIKIASLSPEAKHVARETGQDDNQAALLRAAEHDDPADQIAALRQAKPNKRHVDVRDAFCAWLDGLDAADMRVLVDLDLGALVAEHIAAKG